MAFCENKEIKLNKEMHEGDLCFIPQNELNRVNTHLLSANKQNLLAQYNDYMNKLQKQAMSFPYEN